MNIGTFIGSWKIQYKSEDAGGPVQNGWILLIGTDNDPNKKGYGDIPPYLDGENTVCVGFALIDATNPASPNVVISTEQHEGNQPAELALVGDHLQWTGFYKQQPTRIYISAAQTATVNGGVVYLYGSTTYGDPEQVAVWGGSATSPPQNP
jgi:hypothetical protein